jgi:deoxyribodipyrimidine photo-lyase
MELTGPRIHPVNGAPVDPAGRHVLYWMIAARRVRFNPALERAAAWARELGRPLVVLEALRLDYPWASERLHRFIVDGMADTRRRLRGRPVAYHPYVEPERGAGRGLLAALAEEACVVVTDAYPTFFLPRMVAAAGARIDRRLEAVDGNGLLPMTAPGKEVGTAYAFRRIVQKTLADHLDDLPLDDPLAEAIPPPQPLPEAVAERWPAATTELLDGDDGAWSALPLDRSVPRASLRGGAGAAEATLGTFLDARLRDYATARNRPDEEGASGLSPYLHFGHLSAHQVFLELMARERWTPEDLSPRADGRRSGWWGVGESAEAFLDQLVTWRELGFNLCHHRDDHDRFSAVPEWARTTLVEHAADPREHLYSRDELAAAATHDPLWNAAQRQLTREGRLHNYLRMLWGKKILEWTPSPQQALEIMLDLNNRYALDGRDPNSASGILWILGRFDRPWGPERPVFGKVRYMSSANTARKLPVRGYLERYGPEPGGAP